MSAIGDYIHLNTINYIKYGVGRNSLDNGRQSAASAYMTQKNANLQKINTIPNVNQNVLNELKQRVIKNFPEGKNAGQAKALKKQSELKLSEKFKNYLLNEQIGFIGVGNAYKVKATSSNSIEVNGVNRIEGAKRSRANLLSRIDYFNKHPNESTPNTIIRHLEDYFKYLGVSLPINEYVTVESIKNTDVLTALQNLVTGFSFDEADKATVNGQIGEQTIALCGDIAVRKGLEAVNGAIVGAKGTKFQMNKSIIPKSIATQFKKDTGINLYQVRSSQDKMDVQIVVNKQPLNVSVKAYTSRNNKLRTHLQDVSLLTSLATTTGDFANHWLNIHTLGVGSQMIFDEALKEHMKYEALVSGNMLKKGASFADTFVAIDVASGKVFTASAKDILMNHNSLSYFTMYPNISGLKIGGNNFVPGPGAWAKRISNILQEVRKINISVGLTISLADK